MNSRIAILVSDAGQVSWWKNRLGLLEAPFISESPKALDVQIYPQGAPLPRELDELIVIAAGEAQVDVLEQTKLHEAITTFHHIGGGERESSYRWEDQEALASYLEVLFINLANRAIFGVRWGTSRQHQGLAVSRIGKNMDGCWKSILPNLLNGDELEWAVSLTVFLRGGPQITIGDYAEACEWLQKNLSAQCEVFVSMVPNAPVEGAALVLVTI